MKRGTPHKISTADRRSVTHISQLLPSFSIGMELSWQRQNCVWCTNPSSIEKLSANKHVRIPSDSDCSGAPRRVCQFDRVCVKIQAIWKAVQTFRLGLTPQSQQTLYISQSSITAFTFCKAEMKFARRNPTPYQHGNCLRDPTDQGDRVVRQTKTEEYCGKKAENAGTSVVYSCTRSGTTLGVSAVCVSAQTTHSCSSSDI